MNRKLINLTGFAIICIMTWWGGLGIDIWKSVAQEMGVLYEFREYKSFGHLFEPIENGEMDAITYVPAELMYEIAMDLSQSYYKSGLAIAVPTEVGDYGWMRVVAKIFSIEILEPIILL